MPWKSQHSFLLDANKASGEELVKCIKPPKWLIKMGCVTNNKVPVAQEDSHRSDLGFIFLFI